MSEPLRSDLAVEPISDVLKGWTLDVVVSGSIGAVESVRFIRALRRLGAQIVPWLTTGGARFVTDVALGWAAGRPARAAFMGDASHIATGDACVVAPASANIIGQAAHGLTDTPATALIASYLGAKKPVCLVPNMHDSLALSPAIVANLARLEGHGAHILASRQEEGKRKFPDPAQLADEIAHRLRTASREESIPRVLVTMGTTRGYIDDVRYVSNYSSGALGSLVVEELHRFGIFTDVVCGPCPIKPRVFGQFTAVETNTDMANAAKTALDQGATAAILAASVLDFAPVAKTPGKIKSADHAELTVSMTRQPKIIADIHPKLGLKVGFKLETGLSEEKASLLAGQYMPLYDLSLMVLNDLSDVDESRHKAWIFERHMQDGQVTLAGLLDSKPALAKFIVHHIISRLSN